MWRYTVCLYGIVFKTVILYSHAFDHHWGYITAMLYGNQSKFGKVSAKKLIMLKVCTQNMENSNIGSAVK